MNVKTLICSGGYSCAYANIINVSTIYVTGTYGIRCSSIVLSNDTNSTIHCIAGWSVSDDTTIYCNHGAQCNIFYGNSWIV